MSGLQKNVASQKWLVFAFDRTDNTPKTGDAANITSKIRIDYGTATASNDTNPAEIEDGYYEFDLTQAETNGDVLDILPESSTSDIQVIGVPGRSFTVPSGFADKQLPTASAIADAVWDEETGGHDVFGTYGGEVLNGEVLVRTDIATLSSQTVFTLTDGSADNDAYNGHLCVVQDFDTAAQKAVGIVSDYVGSTKEVTLVADPGIYLMAAFDRVTIVAINTSALVADAVWDEAQGDHTTAGSFGEVATETAAILVDTGTTIPAVLGTPAADLATDIAANATLIGALNDLSAAEVNAEVDTALNTAIPGSPTANSINERLAAIDDLTQASGAGDLAAILVDTGTTIPGVLGTPAGADLATDIAANATLIGALNDLSAAEVNAEVDTAISDAALATAANLATVDTVVDAIQAKTDSLTFTVANQVDANMVAISGSTTSADNLEESTEAIITGTTSGTPTTVATDSDLTGFVDNELIGRTIIFKSGTANGQASDITDYASTNGVVTYTAIATAPASGDLFVIL